MLLEYGYPKKYFLVLAWYQGLISNYKSCIFVIKYQHFFNSILFYKILIHYRMINIKLDETNLDKMRFMNIKQLSKSIYILFLNLFLFNILF